MLLLAAPASTSLPVGATPSCSLGCTTDLPLCLWCRFTAITAADVVVPRCITHSALLLHDFVSRCSEKVIVPSPASISICGSKRKVDRLQSLEIVICHIPQRSNWNYAERFKLSGLSYCKCARLVPVAVHSTALVPPPL
ncbi:hypothetical protein FVEG_15836 [Fusarium verticillioides 7600]|uniref:Uncharacterized protein n=1 Tax=Gibberella moniliformis (strain M3125 / FGSC 7600) TaxID=334819 RepID=W7M3K9_GIBM7|nr:hypothetical protein FVEG_15836 [Fusarium verticillioides 7600]XP_018751763.1 hypothetical protein FVEG_15836 [Fusarium verticillioides 7600]EWG45571.1 hypothetical protein FVEG_15836 [Fusarium verticillioides 7600]EWG45572.1 hypothetical protein FVEG_15836 [Fusarium verticillioides 7600]